MAFSHIFNCVYWTTFHNSLWSCMFWHCMLPSSSMTCSSLLVYVFSSLHLLLCSTYFVVVLFFLCLPLLHVFSHVYMHCCPNHIVLAHFFLPDMPCRAWLHVALIFLHFIPSTVFCCLFCWLFSCMPVFSYVFAVQLPTFIVCFPGNVWYFALLVDLSFSFVFNSFQVLYSTCLT